MVSLILHRMTLSFTAPRRFSPAHKEVGMSKVLMGKMVLVAAVLAAALSATVASSTPSTTLLDP